MATIVTRSGKGSALTHGEMDANFTNLNTDKLDKAGSVAATADLPMGTNKVTGVGDPTAAQDAATKTYVDTADATKLNLSGGTMSGAIAMGANAITGVSDPSSAQDAATKAYADTKLANIVEDNSPQLGSTLDQNGQNINDASRNFSLLSNVTDPTAHGFFSFASSGARAFGPAMVNVLTSNQSNRVYQNISAASAQLSADLSGSAQAGRIRQNFLEGNLVTDGFDLTTTGFGRGHHACWISAEVSNNHASNSSTVTESTALSVIPQYEGTQSLTVTNGTGVAVQAFVDSANQTITNFVGYQYEHPAGTVDNFPASANHWSFKSTSSAAKLQNDGPAILSGLAYPTSDGSNGQFLKTNGSGTLSFATPTAFDGDLDGADLTDSGGDLTIKPSGATNAKLEILNNGNDSITLKLGATSTDGTGTSFDAIDQTGARAKMAFTGKRMDFNSAGANLNFITAAAAEPIRFLPANGESTTAELAITSDGSGTLSVLSNVNMIIGEDSGAQISMPSGNDRVAVNKMFEFASFTTTQRDAIGTPNNGSVLYNTTLNKLQVYANGAWVNLH